MLVDPEMSKNLIFSKHASGDLEIYALDAA
jgi:hypothetical protein